MSRAFGAIRAHPGWWLWCGEHRRSGGRGREKQAPVDLDIVVEHSASIVGIAGAVRRNVITAVERMTGLDVIEVDIAVRDIQIRGVGDGAEAAITPLPRRVQ